jgi:signal transduction histidine kinase
MRLLWLSLMLLGTVAQAQPTLDSLRRVGQDRARPATERLAALQQLSWAGYLFRQPDSALWVARRQYQLALQAEQPRYQALALNTQGIAHLQLGQPDSALALLRRSLQAYQAAGDSAGAAQAYLNLGNVRERLGQYPAAAQAYQRSLRIAEQRLDTPSLARSLNNLGNVYGYDGDLLRAIAYYQRGLALRPALTDPAIVSALLTNLGSAYGTQQDYEKALSSLRQGLALRQQMGDQRGIAESLNFIGSYYHRIGRDRLAIAFLQRGLDLAQSIQDQQRVLLLSGNLAEVYLAQDQPEKALPYAEQALQLAQQGGSAGSRQGSMQVMAQIQAALGHYQAALALTQAYTALRDSLLNQENRRELIRQEEQYKYERQREQDRQARKTQRIITLAVSLVLLLTLIFVLLLFNRLRVTRRQKAIIEREKRRAEASERFKEQFLANMSHEIRTPVHAISGLIKQLRRYAPSAEQGPALDAMASSAAHLTVILNDILDLAKLEAGKLEIEQTTIYPRRLLAQVCDLFASKAQEKALDLGYEVAEVVPEAVMGDAIRLQQVLTNLLGNALKFTDQGGIVLRLSRGDDYLLWEVTDSGIGIAPDQVEQIFEAFVQADAKTSRRYGGTGLGLRISQQLVERQGGRIWVESEPGVGSRFCFTLPLTLPEAKEASPATTSEATVQHWGQALRGLRILLAEDHPFNVMVVQDDLSYYIPDLHLDLVEQGHAAVAQVQQQRYDLVLMDVHMPEMDGYEATRAIRSWEQAHGKPRVSILAMTASVLPDELQRCYAAGMDGHISKPYELAQLLGSIRDTVSHSISGPTA